MNASDDRKEERLAVALAWARSSLWGVPRAKEEALLARWIASEDGFGLSMDLALRYAEAAVALRDRAGSYEDARVPEGEAWAALSKPLRRYDEAYARRFLALPEHVSLVLAGRKTVCRRARLWGDPADEFSLLDRSVVLVRTFRRKVGEMAAADARREGYESLDEFRAMWQRAHPHAAAGGIARNPDRSCWVHEFEVAPDGL